ncbi:MAG: hypothetical protein IJQ67_01940 [Bacilli bacterium]|nr:hypothetical protein [Bacilli bacterium]
MKSKLYKYLILLPLILSGCSLTNNDKTSESNESHESVISLSEESEEESLPVEESSEETPVSEESLPTEESSLEEESSEEMTIVDESIEIIPVSEEESVPAEESLEDESVPVEESLPVEISSEEEVLVSEESLPVEESIPAEESEEESLPAEESVPAIVSEEESQPVEESSEEIVDDRDEWTIMIYMCGSDLESTPIYDKKNKKIGVSGYASQDISEILSVANQPDDVNIIIETGGSAEWDTTHDIASDKLSRYHVRDNELVLDKTLKNKSMGEQATFESFLEWGLTTYPAKKTGVILWNHGGALDGCCSDENYEGDTLLNSEAYQAFYSAFNECEITENLEFVGYDCCLMQVQDIAEFNSHFFNYMIASQESEAGTGWDYANWVDDLYKYADTEVILDEICRSFIQGYDDYYGGRYDNDQTLSVLDLSKMNAYKTALENFSKNNKTTFLNNKSKVLNIAKASKEYGATSMDEEEYEEYIYDYGYPEEWFDEDGEYYLLHGYYLYGVIDAVDFFTKLKANSTFKSLASDIENIINLIEDMVIINCIGDEAGNSNGLSLHFQFCQYWAPEAAETSFNRWNEIALNCY